MSKKILVDLDGVTYNWVVAMDDWLKKNNVVKQTPTFTKYELWEDYGIPKGEFMRWWRMGAEKQEIYAKGEPIPKARESLWKLNDAGWDIHIATKRLTKFGLYDQVVINTAMWLRDNNIPYRELSFVNDKHKIEADAAVDDVLDHLNPKKHGKCFLFPMFHNESDEVPKGVLKVSPYSPAPWDVIIGELL